jgi:hypothetical protein
MAIKLLSLFAAVLFTASCQLPWSHSACDTTHIDWVNFVQVGSTHYVAGLASAPDTLQEKDLGPIYANVKFKVSDNVCDVSYRPKDGDAAFLEPGTPIYEVAGRPPAEQLAARFNGALVLYRAVAPAS